MTGFESEAALVNRFIDAVRQIRESPFYVATVAQEFDYRSGRADVVTVSWEGEVLAFEAKLSRWRDALHQAYRNTCFAHRSYVLLPWSVAERAAMFESDFHERGVGLCAVNGERIVMLLDAPRLEPLQPWLADRAVEHANLQERERRWLTITNLI